MLICLWIRTIQDDGTPKFDDSLEVRIGQGPHSLAVSRDIPQRGSDGPQPCLDGLAENLLRNWETERPGRPHVVNTPKTLVVVSPPAGRCWWLRHRGQANVGHATRPSGAARLVDDGMHRNPAIEGLKQPSVPRRELVRRRSVLVLA